MVAAAKKKSVNYLSNAKLEGKKVSHSSTGRNPVIVRFGFAASSLFTSISRDLFPRRFPAEDLLCDSVCWFLYDAIHLWPVFPGPLLSSHAATSVCKLLVFLWLQTRT
jgi:hypothetical protein